MALAALCLFAACSEKEGVYNPKKKIANIYKSGVTIHSSLDESTGLWYSDTVTVAKYLSEAWTWDGKKLTKVTFYEQNASNEVRMSSTSPTTASRWSVPKATVNI